jgi:DNA invertase Pin-like site-specific DNA recombinase
MSNVFGYERISTKEEQGKQKFNRQDKALKKYADENNIEYTVVFKEDESGKNFTDRKQWNKLEKLLQKGDTVVFKDISRFTREAENGYNKYMELMNKGIELIFLDNQTISTEYIKQLLNVAEQQNLVARTSLESTVKLLLIVELDRAEQERLILINRIKNGIAASNKKQGRKTGSLIYLSDDLKTDINKYLQDRSIKQVDLMKKHNISRNTLKKYINIIQSDNSTVQ